MATSLFSVAPQKCQRCETLPQRLEGSGTLLIRFPVSHSFSKILVALKANRWQFSRTGDTLQIEVSGQGLSVLAQTLSETLSVAEQKDARVVFHPDNAVAMFNTYFDVEPLDIFLARAQGSWLIDMMSEERLTNEFQPIVDMSSGEAFGYECLLRGRDQKGIVSPGIIFETARAMGILFQLDLAARRTAIRNATLQGLTCKVFVNFTPTAIYDPKNCLSSTVALCRECGLEPQQIVFEVIETDYVRDMEHLVSILDYYRSRGFGVALDDLGSGYSSLQMMRQLKPDYVKIDRELIAGVDQDTLKASTTRQMLESAQEAGIKTIIEGIERIEELQWCKEHGATYAQGYLLGRPTFPVASPQWPL